MDELNTTLDTSDYKDIKTVDLAKMFDIAESTVRKYAQELEKAGYRFTKDSSGTRVFKEKDQIAFLELIKLRKESGISLEMAAAVATTRRQNADNPTQSVQSYSNQQNNALEVQHAFKELHNSYKELSAAHDHILSELKKTNLQNAKQTEQIEHLLKNNEEFKSKLDLAVKYIQKQEEKQEELEKNPPKTSFWQRIFG